MGPTDRNDGRLPDAPPYRREDLDADPQRAYEAFYRYAVAHLRILPPAPLRAVREEDRLDLVHEVVMHCCRQEFRVLRSHQPGRSFSTWFAFVARNHVIDLLRRGGSDLDRRGESSPVEHLHHVPEPAADPARLAEDRDLVRHVADALHELSDKCQILLLGSAEGRTPRELLELLEWPARLNKKASDDLRACRARLIRRLADRGLEVAEFLGGE
jgi:RNA polymerase sigma factor (sigma-70 family)